MRDGLMAALSIYVMKQKLTILVLGLLLSGCSQHDANDTKYRTQILGTWHQASAPRGVDSTMTFASDGTFSSPSQEASHPKPYTGTWQISDGVLTLSHTDPAGTNEYFTITQLDEHQMISAEGGVTFSLSR